MKCVGNRMYDNRNFFPRQLLEMSGQLHAFGALPPNTNSGTPWIKGYFSPKTGLPPWRDEKFCL
jgi:hypothetical protein